VGRASLVYSAQENMTRKREREEEARGEKRKQLEHNGFYNQGRGEAGIFKR